jgi:hypothetical protein
LGGEYVRSLTCDVVISNIPLKNDLEMMYGNQFAVEYADFVECELVDWLLCHFLFYFILKQLVWQ